MRFVMCRDYIIKSGQPPKITTNANNQRKTMTCDGFQALALAALVFVGAAPAVAQRYHAKQDGDLVALEDTSAKMKVEVVTSMGKAWKIQVNGQNLVRTSASLESFLQNSGLNGMPLLAPFAN